jgi:ParB family chromosome partitioning protein
MSPKLIKVRPEDCDCSSQPRSNTDPAYCRSLGESIKTIGQQVPIIGYTDPVTGRFNVGDGMCRVQSSILCGIPELLALDLGKAPTPLELQMAQAAIDIHKKHFPPMDRARLWHSIKELRGCTARQLAKELQVSDSLVGDLLSLLTLPADVQEQVNTGAVDMSKASLIAQKESDPVRQRELAALAKNMSRNELAAKVRQPRPNGQQAPADKVNKIKIELTSATVTISGSGLTLDAALEAVFEAHKVMKKGREQGLTAKTIQKISSDRAAKAAG